MRLGPWCPRQHLQPRGGRTARGWMRGEAGRPGSRPAAMTRNPVLGTKDALPGSLRRPLDAWPAWPPCRAGYRRPASPQPAPPCPRACVEGIPGSFPAKSGVGAPRHRRSAGLAAMPVKVSDCDPRLLRWGAALQVSRHPISEADALCHAASAPSRTVYI